MFCTLYLAYTFPQQLKSPRARRTPEDKLANYLHSYYTMARPNVNTRSTIFEVQVTSRTILCRIFEAMHLVVFVFYYIYPHKSIVPDPIRQKRWEEMWWYESVAIWYHYNCQENMKRPHGSNPVGLFLCKEVVYTFYYKTSFFNAREVLHTF